MKFSSISKGISKYSSSLDEEVVKLQEDKEDESKHFSKLKEEVVKVIQQLNAVL